MTAYTREMYVRAAAEDYAEGVNAIVPIIYAAPRRGLHHVISGVAWSFSAVPVGAPALTILDGTTIVFRVHVTEAGYDSVQFDPPKSFSLNAPLTIILDAAGGAIVGRLNVLGHWTDTA